MLGALGGRKQGSEEEIKVGWNCSWWLMCSETRILARGERDELREVNTCAMTGKKFGVREVRVMVLKGFAAARGMSVGTGVTVGKLRHGGCQTVSRLLFSPPREMSVMNL